MLVSYANTVYGMSSLIIYVVVPSSPFRFRCTCFHPCFEKKMVLASPSSHLLMTSVSRHIFPQQGTTPNDFFVVTSIDSYVLDHFWFWLSSPQCHDFSLWLKITADSFFLSSLHSSLVFRTFPDPLQTGNYYLKFSSELWILLITFYLCLCRWNTTLFISLLHGFFPIALNKYFFLLKEELSYSVFST